MSVEARRNFTLGTAVRIVRAMQRELSAEAEVALSQFPPHQVLLTPRETALALRVSERTLAYWSKGKKADLPLVKFKGATRYVLADVLAFIDRHKARGGAQPN
jgi:arginyl-tRNA synthetase